MPAVRLPRVPRDTVTRELAHEPFGWRPTTLLVTVRRYRCTGCGHVWRQDTTTAAEPRAKISRGGLAWALRALVMQHLTVARIAEGFAVAWDTANDAVLTEGRRVLIDDPTRLDGVTVIGVDEHSERVTFIGGMTCRDVATLPGCTTSGSDIPASLPWHQRHAYTSRHRHPRAASPLAS